MSITFCHSLGGPPAAVLYEIVLEYNQNHKPIVQLEVINPKEYATAAKEALAKPPEQRPNLILAPEYMTGACNEALKKGVVVSVSTLLDKATLDDIAEIVKRTFGTDCLPFNPACGVLYINKSLLEKSELPVDWKPKTFEDLVTASQQIKVKTGTSSGFTCAWPEAYLAEMVLAQRNLSLLEKNGDYNFVQLKQHILDLRDLVKEEILLPPNTGNYDPTRADFIKGKVAFYMQGSGHFETIEREAKEAGFEVGHSALPTLSRDQKHKYAINLGGAAIWALDTGKSVEGVRDFLNYLASKKVQAKWHMKTAYVPVSKSIRETLGKEHEGFYESHPLHEAVVSQTIEAALGENCFGIKRADYNIVRPKLYPLMRELLLLEGTDEEVSLIIDQRLNDFQLESNAKK